MFKIYTVKLGNTAICKAVDLLSLRCRVNPDLILMRKCCIRPFFIRVDERRGASCTHGVWGHQWGNPDLVGEASWRLEYRRIIVEGWPQFCLGESKVGGSTGAEFGVQVHMKRYGRFVIMRSSGPEICGLEIGRKSRGGYVGFSIWG